MTEALLQLRTKAQLAAGSQRELKAKALVQLQAQQPGQTPSGAWGCEKVEEKAMAGSHFESQSLGSAGQSAAAAVPLGDSWCDARPACAPSSPPAGPRKKHEGVEDEDQGIVQAEPTPTGGAQL